MPNERELAQLVADLVAIDSVNPDLVPGGAGEGAAARFAAAWLERAGLEVHLQEVLPGRPNVVAVARGSGGGPSLMLNGHLDTVGAGGMRDAHEPLLDGERLRGRGAYDMKGGLAAAMMAAATVRGLRGDVVLAAVCDEEMAGRGTAALLRDRTADAAIVPEPTDLDVGVAHKGFVGFRIETAGVAAHGSMPHLGRDAIVAMAPVLAALRDLDEELQAGPRHPLLGVPSLHASIIAGGQELSSYPAACVLHGEVRTLPGMPDAGALVREAVGRSGAAAQVTVELTADAMETDPGERVAELLLRLTGRAPVGLPYWTDAAQLSAAGTPAVLYGPAGGGAHGDEEWVDLDSVRQVRDVLASIAREFCGSAP